MPWCWRRARPAPEPVAAGDTSGSFLPPKARLPDGSSALVAGPRSPWLDTKVYLPDDGGLVRVERRGGWLDDRMVVERD